MTNSISTEITTATGELPHTLPARPAQVVLSAYTVAAIGELLSMCDEFLRTAGPAVRDELRAYLRHQYLPTDPGWLIDMLGFNSMHLHHQLHQQIPGQEAPSPRENRQPRNADADADGGAA